MATVAPELSIVIPVFNEQECLPELHERLINVLDAYGRSYEIVYVDDGSKDSTLTLLKAFHEAAPRTRVVQLAKNFGQSPALYAGFSQVRGRIVATLDADLQNPPEEVPKLIDKLDEGYDAVYGWRVNRHDTAFRLWASRLLNAMVARIMQVDVHDHGCSLKAFRREVVDQLSGLFSHHSRYLPTEVAWLGVRIGEVEVAHMERADGKSKYGLFELVATSFDLLTTITTAPFEFVGVIGGILSALGILVGAFVALRWLFVGTSEPFAFVAALMLFLVGVQLIVTSFMCEYISRIFREVQNKPYFIIKEIVG